MEQILNSKIAEGFCKPDEVTGLARKFKLQIGIHLGLLKPVVGVDETAQFGEQQLSSYTFMCEKRIVWESKVKDHIHNIIVVPPPPPHITYDTGLGMMVIP